MRRLTATYRLQLHRDVGFAAAEALVPYLAKLGVSHLYASPIAAAVPGSQHGYDVTDPTIVNPELGGMEGFVRLAERLHAAGLGLILDIVPNHMALSSRNPFLMEALELGPRAPAARLFDIDWSGKLLLPLLGDTLAATLARGEIGQAVDWQAGRMAATYADWRFPLAPASVAHLLRAASLGQPTVAEAAARWAGLAADAGDAAAIAAARDALRALPDDARAAVEAALAAANTRALLEAQHWELGFWRRARDRLSHRRFFNITELIGLRVEDEAAFELVHRLPLELLRQGLVDGLRVDHIDGLADPAGYCARLRAAAGPKVPILVEKILGRDEALPPWPVDGTTGYERLNDINGLLIDRDGYRALDAHLRDAGLLRGSAAARLADAKREILETTFGAELAPLAELGWRCIAGEARREIERPALRRGLVALIAHLPVYRSYVAAGGAGAADLALFDAARHALARREDALTRLAAEALLDVLAAPEGEEALEFAIRLQQLAGPAMAKGFEDTELYRHVVLLSANEVGADLERPWRARAELHALAERRAAEGRRDLLPLATHDTKRGPDVRARLNALAGRPQAWLAFAGAAKSMAAPLRRRLGDDLAPDDLDLWLILQTLAAAWPISGERIAAYLEKALREAKRHTSWEAPDAAYEAAAIDCARAIVEGEGGRDIRAALAALLAAVDPAARMLSLVQVILQMTLPGTPDIYQGSEFLDRSLVDPDNRRPVDWTAREAAIEPPGGPFPAEPASEAADVEKARLTRDLLRLRAAGTALVEGAYRPLAPQPSPWRWFAFLRESRGDGERPGEAVLVAVPTRVPAEPAPPVIGFDARPEGDWQPVSGAVAARSDAALTLDPARPWLVARRAG